MKRLCKNCGNNIQDRPDNVKYCSSRCYTESQQRQYRVKKENNPYFVYWKYKVHEMITGKVYIEDLVEREVYKVCDYHHTNDRFINNKANI